MHPRVKNWETASRNERWKARDLSFKNVLGITKESSEGRRNENSRGLCQPPRIISTNIASC